MKLKLLLTFTLFCNVFLINATTNSLNKTINLNNEILANEITCSVSSTSFCRGAKVSVTFTASGTYNSGNVFTAQLSNAAGFFTSPVNIGTKTDIVSGIISAVIRPNATFGTRYRIRVVASNPSIVGSDNGVDLAVSPQLTPSFPAIAPICSGVSITPLPSTSTNGITGTWSPALDNTQTTTYTFTPDYGQCATTVMLTITISPQPTAGVLIGNQNICEGATTVFTSTAQGEIWRWSSANTSIATVNTATGFVTGISSGTTTIAYTVIGTGGCVDVVATRTVTVDQLGIPKFESLAPICSGSTAPVLPITSANGITGTWSPSTVSNSTSGSYKFTPDPLLFPCATTQTLNVAVTTKVIPTFTAIAPICSGVSVTPLPTTSTNGITGTWSPSLNNIQTTTYTFTPTPGLCATTVMLTITVNVNTLPIANATPLSLSICSGETTNIALTSDQPGTTFNWMAVQTGVTGALAGSVSAIQQTLTTSGNSQGSVDYTITPIANGCSGIPIKATVTVNPLANPIITDGVICVNRSTNTVFKPFILDTGLGNTNYGFNWFLNRMLISGATSSSYEATQQGLYSVIAINKFTGCNSKNVSATVIANYPAESFTAVVSDNFNQNATITITVSGGTGPFLYQLDEGVLKVSNVFTDVNAGIHKITLKDVNDCTYLNQIVAIPESPVPAPSGNRLQSFTQGQTLADLIVIGSNIQWYADATANRKASSPLPLNTLLVNNTTYYASQTINVFESPTRLPVTVQVALSNHSFAFKDLQVSPNPIIDVLNIKSKEIVKKVTVYNTLGQEVSHKEGNGLEFKLDLSNLVSGNYFVKVASENKQQVLKVVKK